VSGDKHLLRMAEFRGARILKCLEFVALMDSGEVDDDA